jgi:uncharacterized membrane protein YczE
LAREGLYQAFAIHFNFNFGSCKIYGDIILVLIAVVSAYLSLHTIIGVREETLITVLCVDSLVKIILPKLNFIYLNAATPITS